MTQNEADSDAQPYASIDNPRPTTPPFETTGLLSASPCAPEYQSTDQLNPPDVNLLPEGDNGNDTNDVEGQNQITSGISKQHSKSPWGTLSVLLLGVFVAQLDQSLVIATYSKVASDFHHLDLGSWMLSAYALSQCAVQPLYGKLSDIYSRKSCLITAYLLFTIGTAGAGLSRSMVELIIWRAVQGAGGSGMVSVVSIIITDIVPKRNIATMRSYVNILQTTGRSCGGVIGGLLTQAVGWRWAFLIQVPPMVAALILVACGLRLPSSTTLSTPSTATGGGTKSQTQWDKLRRVDFIGSFFLLITILSICLILELGGKRLPWTSPKISALLATGAAAGLAFVVTAKFVREPIFPLRLLTYWTVVSNYAVVLLSMTAQVSLMTAVPIYFQATSHASTAAAGVYLIPAFVGNTMGGLIAGYWIKRTGRYKPATVIAPLISVFCMALLFFTWHGNTSPAESVYVLPGGFAMGMVYASTFVGIVAGMTEDDIAVGASGMYLFFNLGAIVGVSAGSAVSQTAIRAYLDNSLQGLPHKHKIIKNALADLSYIWNVESDDLRQILISAYTHGFNAINLLGIGCSFVAFLFAVLSRGTQLNEAKTS